MAYSHRTSMRLGLRPMGPSHFCIFHGPLECALYSNINVSSSWSQSHSHSQCENFNIILIPVPELVPVPLKFCLNKLWQGSCPGDYVWNLERSLVWNDSTILGTKDYNELACLFVANCFLMLFAQYISDRVWHLQHVHISCSFKNRKYITIPFVLWYLVVLFVR